jgi:para-nitrobenzyl esterase
MPEVMPREGDRRHMRTAGGLRKDATSPNASEAYMRNLLLLLCLVISVPALASDLDNIVKIDSGYVLGSGTDVRVYKGIPYAAPPVGELRWRAPQPVKSWDSIRVSKTFSLACSQPAMAGAKERIGEDCLTINVWTPARTAGARLPVLVSIPGGGFVAGSSALTLTDGERLARENVVVVSFNYRLGIFGFLAHPQLSQESPQAVSGNYALLDMVAALQWVQRNIAALGGDPGDVTIWGESAGGAAVGLLLVVPQAEGLFHKAIMNSAWSMYHPIGRLREGRAGRSSAESQGAALGSIAALRAKSADELLQMEGSALSAAGTIDPEQAGQTIRPIVDGVVLPDDPAALFTKGAFHHVPLLAGANADEGVFFAPRGVTTREQADAWLRTQFGSAAAASLAALYRLDSGTPAVAVTQLTGDALVGMGTRAMLRAAVRYNPHVYQYAFTRVSPLAARMKINAFHGADLSYTFGTLPESALNAVIPGFSTHPGDYDETDERLSRAMSGAIVQFAKHGDPNGKGLPKWTRYASGESYLEYGDSIVQQEKLRSQYLDALDGIFAARRAPDSREQQ